MTLTHTLSGNHHWFSHFSMTHPLPKKYRKISLGFESRYPYTLYFILRGLAGKKHGAWDLPCPEGTPLKAPCRMQVHEVKFSTVGYGNRLRAISLDDKVTEFLFAHLSVIPYPRPGKIWQEGQTFAWSGNSGTSTASHLHFEVRRQGKLIDPSTLKLT